MKKILTVLMCAAIISVPFYSCEHDSTINESSEISQADEDNNFKEDSLYYTGTFNAEVFEHIIKNINLKGAKISMPCTLKDMGNGFEVSDPLVFEKEAIATYALNYKDVYIGQILYDSDYELTEEELEKEKFSGLYVNSSVLPLANINVAGIEIGSDYKELEVLMGQPTSKNHDRESGSYTYKLSEQKYIEFNFRDDSIYSICINVK